MTVAELRDVLAKIHKDTETNVKEVSEKEGKVIFTFIKEEVKPATAQATTPSLNVGTTKEK